MENKIVKILAIDDNNDNIITIKALIYEAFPDAIVISALTGQEGIKLAATDDPDVILLDIVMPIMDGFEVCKRLKSDDVLKDIPIVFVTAIKGDKHSRIKALDIGAEAFLAKPIDQSELTAQIRAMVKIRTANFEKRNENVRLSAIVLERTTELNDAHKITLELLAELRCENEARKNSEDALKKSEEKFRVMTENSSDVIWHLNSDLICDYISPADELMRGFSKDEVLGTPLWSLLKPEGIEHVKLVNAKRFTDALKGLKSGTIQYELEQICKDGSWIWTEANSTAHYNDQGEIIGYHGVTRNISERKLSEHALLKAMKKAEESDRLKSAFLANMSHEIRTPMNGILGFAELLKEPKLTGEEQQEYIGIIQSSGERMLNIINDIICISKIESGQMEVSISGTNTNELIDFIFNFFHIEAEQKGIQLLCEKSLPTTKDIIFTDHEKVYAILANLVKNALKFTFEGSVRFGYQVKMDSANAELEFFVADTGIGISDEQKQIIFERFRQGNDSLSRDFEGAGLGLSISKAYVEMLGGRIWLESTKGNGSVFYFTLPYKNPKIEKNLHQLADSKSIAEVPVKNLKILIAEDDQISQLYISQAIKVFGDEVFIAKNGVEAVEFTRRNPDLDLILMDIKMPLIDGYEATQQIRQFNSTVVIIAQTAFALTGDQEKIIEAGCNDYISKPVKKLELIELIKKYF